MTASTLKRLQLPAAVLLVIGLSVGLFASTLDTPFTSDDIIVTIENPLAHDPANIPSYFLNDLDWVIPDDVPGAEKLSKSRWGLYRPLLVTSYTLDVLLHGPQPFGWRLTNLVMHIIAALLVLLIGKQLTGSLLGGLVAAGLFAAHPIHVEALASLLGGRAELMASIFVFGAWWVFLKGDRLTGRRRWLVDSGSALIFLLGLFSKENAAMLPAILVLCGWTLRGQSLKTLLLRLTPHLTIFVLYAILRLWVVARIAPNDWAMVFGPLSAVWVVLTIVVILVTYLRMVVFPYPLSHPDCYSILPGSISTAEGLLAAIFLISLIGLAVWRTLRGRKSGKTPFWAFAILLFYLCLVPVAHIIPFRVVMADRFLYLPSVALCLLAGWAAVRLYAYRGWLLAAAGLPVLAACIAGTMAGNAEWVDLDRLYQKLADCNPDSADPPNNMGTLRLRKGRPAEALPFFEKAIAVAPQIPDPHYNKGLALQQLGKYAQAEEAYRQTLVLDPAHGMAANNLGTLLDARGQQVEARKYFQLAVRVDPNHPAALVNLATLDQREGNYQRAEKLFRLALRIDPRLHLAEYNLANLLMTVDKAGQAAVHYKKAIELQPGYLPARIELGRAYLKLGDLAAAKEVVRKVKVLAPDNKQVIDLQRAINEFKP
jgi:protein O-mannosyl-transferase